MKYNYFAAVAVALVSQANAQWEHAYRFSSGISQSDYERYFTTYTTIAQKMRSFVDSHRQPIDNEPIADPLEAFGAVGKCTTCQGAFHYAQKGLRSDEVQAMIMAAVTDACWLVTDVISYDACSLFIEQAAPSICDNIAELIISPEYSC